MWAHALQDCVISTKNTMCEILGEYLCGSETKKDIAKHNKETYVWELSDFDFIAAFGTQRGETSGAIPEL